jgi:hypothetical protein
MLLSLAAGALVLISPPPPLDAPVLSVTTPLLPVTRELEPFAGEEREYAHFHSEEDALRARDGLRWRTAVVQVPG